MGECIYELRNVSKIYGQGEARVSALDQINLKINKGEFVSITGTSGSGKSTLLHLLGVMDSATEGKIFFQGKDISKMNKKEQAKFRCENIGFVFQNFKLLEELTAKENITLPVLIDKKKIDMRHYNEVVQKMGLQDREEHLPSEMSGGQKQRVAIARALMNEPEILLCDEPTGNLDQKTSQEIMKVLKKLNAEGKTIIMVTHDLELARECSRNIRIQDGRMVETM